MTYPITSARPPDQVIKVPHEQRLQFARSILGRPLSGVSCKATGLPWTKPGDPGQIAARIEMDESGPITILSIWYGKPIYANPDKPPLFLV